MKITKLALSDILYEFTSDITIDNILTTNQNSVPSTALVKTNIDRIDNSVSSLQTSVNELNSKASPSWGYLSPSSNKISFTSVRFSRYGNVINIIGLIRINEALDANGEAIINNLPESLIAGYGNHYYTDSITSRPTYEDRLSLEIAGTELRARFGHVDEDYLINYIYICK